MRHVPNDKYSVAWFKLAECVAKGEKEKAFGVYRLLRHSLEDQAYAYQLEGDLLEAFNDERAVEKYHHAAKLYAMSNRYKEAAALYEYLIQLIPQSELVITSLVDLYKKHTNEAMRVSKLLKLIDVLVARKDFARVMPVVGALSEYSTYQEIVGAYSAVVCSWADWQEELTPASELLLEQICCILLQHNNMHELQRLSALLEHVNSTWHKKLCDYIRTSVI